MGLDLVMYAEPEGGFSEEQILRILDSDESFPDCAYWRNAWDVLDIMREYGKQVKVGDERSELFRLTRNDLADIARRCAQLARSAAAAREKFEPSDDDEEDDDEGYPRAYEEIGDYEKILLTIRQFIPLLETKTASYLVWPGY